MLYIAKAPGTIDVMTCHWFILSPEIKSCISHWKLSYPTAFMPGLVLWCSGEDLGLKYSGWLKGLGCATRQEYVLEASYLLLHAWAHTLLLPTEWSFPGLGYSDFILFFKNLPWLLKVVLALLLCSCPWHTPLLEQTENCFRPVCLHTSLPLLDCELCDDKVLVFFFLWIPRTKSHA